MDLLIIFFAAFLLISAVKCDQIVNATNELLKHWFNKGFLFQNEPKTDEMKEAEERQSFLTRIAVECSDEAGVEIDEAKKLLLGDLSLQSEEAMVIEK